MPVFYVGRYVNHCAGQNLHCRLSFFLIPAAACHSHKHLSAALGSFMYMPVVTATGLEGNVGKRNLFA